MKIGAFFIVIALAFSGMGTAAEAFAAPMGQGSAMQMMDCADCPRCDPQDSASPNQDRESENCCEDGLSRCGMSSSSAFYVSPTAQTAVFDAIIVAFAFDNEQAKSVALLPAQQPPQYLS